MSDLLKVLYRAEIDYDFYLAMLKDPAKAIAPYLLSDAERNALTSDPTSLWRLVSLTEVQRVPRFVGGLSEEGPPSEGPPSEGPPSEGPPSEGPPSEGPPSEGPPSEGPPSEGPPSEGPPSEGPPSEGPPSEGPPSEGPPSEGPPSEGPPSEGPPSEGPPPGIGIVSPVEGPPQEGPPIEGPAPGIGIVNIGGTGGGVGGTPSVGGPPSPGIVGVFHFLTGFEVSVVSEAAIREEILANVAVSRAVQDIRDARSSAERLAAVNDLMGEIG